MHYGLMSFISRCIIACTVHALWSLQPCGLCSMKLRLRWTLDHCSRISSYLR